MNKLRNFSISSKITLSSIVLLVIFLLPAFGYLVHKMRSNLVEQSIEQLELRVVAKGRGIQTSLESIKSTLKTLQGTPPFAGYILASKNDGFDEIGNSTSEQWLERLTRIFESQMNASDLFNQLRYVNTDGREIIRIDRIDEKILRVRDEDLQNKGNRPYIIASRNLKHGEVYVSDVSLNREGVDVAISEPYTLVLRYVLPVFDRDTNTRAGSFIGNVVFEELLWAAALNRDKDTSAVVIDPRGYYLEHTTAAKKFGSPEDLDTGENFFVDYPEIESVIRNQIQGSFETDDKVFVFQKIFPNESQQDLYWVIIEYTQKQTLFGFIDELIREVVVITIILVIVLLALLVFLIRKLLKPLEELVDVAVKIGKGDFNQHIDYVSSDEIGVLSQVINTMTDNLSGLYSNLETEVEDKTEALKSKVDELENTKKAIVNVLDDVDEARRIAKSEEEKLNTILYGIGDGVFVINKDRHITLFNHMAVEISGFSSESVLGKKYDEVLKFISEDSGEVDNSFIDQAFATGEIQQMKKHTELVRKDGSKVAIADSAAPLKNNDDEIANVVVVFREATKERQIEQAKNELEEVSTRLHLATQSAHIGIWDWDVPKNILNWDENMYRMHGLTPQEEKRDDVFWKKKIYPEDLKQVEEEVQQALEGEKEFNTILRVEWEDGSLHYLRTFAFVKRDDTGAPLRMMGVSWDITKEMQVDQAKTEFVSLASHQLRTPLTAIRWYLELLLSGESLDHLSDEQREYLKEIDHGNTRMVDLVNSLLNVSRIELGTFAVDVETLNLKEFLENILKDLQILSKKKHQTFTITHTEAPESYQADPKLLGIIVQNLVSNAIKYTPEEGEVKLTVSQDEKYLKIDVEDSGYGIPKNQQEKIFHKLFRADNVKVQDATGSGLGLYVVKAIVQQAGGNISFDSEENKGTHFSVKLPLKGMKPKEGSKPLEA